MFNRLSKNPLATISVIVLLMTITSFNYLPVSIMEARNFVTAREMVTDGNWLLPTINGAPRYQKPPLPTWLSAISASLFGLKNVFAFRLPAILALLILGIFSYKFKLTISNSKNQAFIGSLIVLTSFYVLAIAIEAPWDIFAHSFILISIYYLYGVFSTTQLNYRTILLAALFLGFSILSKGPIPIYALLLPFLISLLITHKSWFTTKKIGILLGIILLGLIFGGWWFIYVRAADPLEFARIADKETSNWSSYNIRPFYYYWSFFVQSGIWTVPALMSLVYPYMKKRVSNLKAYQLTILWTIISVVLLSLIPEKKSRYLMPVLIPLGLNASFYIEYLFRKFKTIKSYLELIPIYFYFSLLGIVCFVIPISVFYLKDYFVGFSIIWYSFSAISLLFLGLAIFFGLKQKNMKTLFLSPIGIMLSILLFLPPLYNRLNRYQYRSLARVTELPKMHNLYALETIAPELVWDYGDKIPVLDIGSVPTESSFGLLITPNQEEKLQFYKDIFNIRLVSHFNLNRVDRDSKNYKERLETDLYILIPLN